MGLNHCFNYNEFENNYALKDILQAINKDKRMLNANGLYFSQLRV